MTFRALSTVALFSFLLATVFQNQSTAEDWSIRKISPFGKRTAEEKAPKKTKLETEKAKSEKVKKTDEESDELARPLTAIEIRKSFSRIGQETAAAFSRTRKALTPEFDWPKWEPLRIKFPRLMSASNPEKAVPVKAVPVKLATPEK